MDRLTKYSTWNTSTLIGHMTWLGPPCLCNKSALWNTLTLPQVSLILFTAAEPLVVGNKCLMPHKGWQDLLTISQLPPVLRSHIYERTQTCFYWTSIIFWWFFGVMYLTVWDNEADFIVCPLIKDTVCKGPRRPYFLPYNYRSLAGGCMSFPNLYWEHWTHWKRRSKERLLEGLSSLP